jgi:riboflavin biosynthesis pyrimidine reductase
MLEAGGILLAEFMGRGLVDECVIYLAPMVTGGLPAIAGTQDFDLVLDDAEWQRIENDVKLRALVRRSQSGR